MFPTELTSFPQWVCWRLEQIDGKITKVPYNPRTGFKASTIDPSTWTDYATAVAAASNGSGYSGIGFVLTKNDPYFVVDIDPAKGNPAIIEKQIKVVEAFDTYSEVSPSGEGLHLWGKGAVFNGRDRGKIAIYSSERYITMTGIVYKDKPIAERNQLANMLWEELGDNNGGNNIDLKVVSQPEKYTDEIIFNAASQAENGPKFLDLWNGYWQKWYPQDSARDKMSCNEADFALVNILGFYSRNVTQIRRMFLQSALGQREKAKRKAYVDNMIMRSFDNLPPLIDLDAIILEAANRLAAKRKQVTVNINLNANPWNTGTLFEGETDPNYDWTRPPGLLGDISSFIYQASQRPVKEISLAAAIGLMAGICGRAYNVSRTGLNTYILFIAKTGIGKEAAMQGIEKLLYATRPHVPAITEFIGPADIVSGQALIKEISRKPCFVSMTGEFGLKLESMHLHGANPALDALRRQLLILYNKSGHQDILRETIYSDKANNTGIVKSPSFSLLGETTPQTFYRAIDENMISQGLLPRFTCIEYYGNRPEANDEALTIQPSETLIKDFSTLAAGCLHLNQANKVIDVGFAPDAEVLHKKYRSQCDIHINSSDQVVTRELWNRAHLKVLKLSALIAIGQNPHVPVITVQALEWARQLIERDIINMLSKFESGKTGREAGELNQINELVNAISYYVRKEYVNFKSYRLDERMHRDGVIPVAYIQRRLINIKAYRDDRIGATNAINRALKSLVEEGTIREIRSTDLFTKYQTTAKAYFVSDTNRF